MVCGWSEQRSAALIVLGGALLACRGYDAGLLDRPAERSGGIVGGGGRGGAAGMAGSAGRGGSGGSAGQSGAGAGGRGLDPDEPEPARCGDGRVALNEKCDTGVATGMPGACPTNCPPLVNCVTRALEGSNCQAECVVHEQTCSDGDGCCPSNCDSSSDGDCSSRCGDGVVQTAEGETCEADADAETVCPEVADCDDGNVCTTDAVMGSADNCNATCVNTTITALVAGDMCCPSGANANTDSDCRSMCGNAVNEPGEECDGGPGCDAACMLMRTPQQLDCLERLVMPGADEACQRCACLQCTQLVFDCRDDSDATRRMHCETLVTCALANDCNGTPCYCGSADVVTCGFGGGNGDCRMEVEQAAGPSTDPVEILMRNTDTSFALGRAALLGECTLAQCPDDCP